MGKLLRPADDLITPADDLQIVRIGLNPGRKSDFRRELDRAEDRRGDGILPAAAWLMSVGLASKADYLELKTLDHNMGKTTFTFPTTIALALCTTAPTDASTGATLVEASYTGYARKKVEATSLNAATGTSPAKSTNSAELVFAACTASSSTIIGWALLDSTTLAAGNVHYWGTCTSTVISTVATPPTIGTGVLEVTED